MLNTPSRLQCTLVSQLGCYNDRILITVVKYSKLLQRKWLTDEIRVFLTLFMDRLDEIIHQSILTIAQIQILLSFWRENRDRFSNTLILHHNPDDFSSFLK